MGWVHICCNTSANLPKWVKEIRGMRNFFNSVYFCVRYFHLKQNDKYMSLTLLVEKIRIYLLFHKGIRNIKSIICPDTIK